MLSFEKFNDRTVTDAAWDGHIKVVKNAIAHGYNINFLARVRFAEILILRIGFADISLLTCPFCLSFCAGRESHLCDVY